MATEKTTPRLAPTTNESDWYTLYGWKIFNELLTELASSHLQIVWVENFDMVKQVLRHINRKMLIQKFNMDNLDWQMKVDSDGTLYLYRNN